MDKFRSDAQKRLKVRLQFGGQLFAVQPLIARLRQKIEIDEMRLHSFPDRLLAAPLDAILQIFERVLAANDPVCLPRNECAVEGKVAVDVRVPQQGGGENVVIFPFLIAFEGCWLVVSKIQSPEVSRHRQDAARGNPSLLWPSGAEQ